MDVKPWLLHPVMHRITSRAPRHHTRRFLRLRRLEGQITRTAGVTLHTTPIIRPMLSMATLQPLRNRSPPLRRDPLRTPLCLPRR